MSAKLTEYCDNCYLKGHHLWNLEEEKRIPLHCNKYSCRLHGWKRKYKLSRAICDYLKSFKQIRFWTLSMSSKGFSSPASHYKVLSLAYRYFTIFVRRHKRLTETERDFNYVKCIDLHQSGYAHYHGFFDRYISIYKLIPLWKKACKLANNGISIGCSIFAKSLFSAKKAANYISKYVVKTAQKITFRCNYYSKSSKVALFPKHVKSTLWIHTYPGYPIERALRRLSPLLVLKIDIVTNCDPPPYSQYEIIGKYSPLRY